MTPQEFCYWLRGYFELMNTGPKNPDKLCFTKEQTEMIESHLNKVFAEKNQSAAVAESAAMKTIADLMKTSDSLKTFTC